MLGLIDEIKAIQKKRLSDLLVERDKLIKAFATDVEATTDMKVIGHDSSYLTVEVELNGLRGKIRLSSDALTDMHIILKRISLCEPLSATAIAQSLYRAKKLDHPKHFGMAIDDVTVYEEVHGAFSFENDVWATINKG